VKLRKIFFALLGLSALSALWGGDTAVFVDLGFSASGTSYMFAQYGVQADSLQPWAELFLVDTEKNDFVPGGKLSFTHTSPISAAQDGAGAFYRLLTRNIALAERYGVDFLSRGELLYLSPLSATAAAAGAIEFRNFNDQVSYKAVLISTVENSGKALKSSFYITLESTTARGVKKSYTAGSPTIKRPLIAGYQIRKVIFFPPSGTLVFVIETKRPSPAGGFDIRYMVEALRL